VIQQYERELADRLIRDLLAIPGLTFYGITDPAKADQRTPTVAIRLEGYTPRDLAMRLGEQGIFTWDGNYYAINLAERLGVQQSGGMLRIGLAHYNTMEEVERLLTQLRSLAK
jgi:selenocysteine lyase/cysteine desulfurase